MLRITSPAVSVVMAVFNGERFVREAIESVLTQTLPDLELVVVDDGSSDTTPDIVASYHDPRVRLLRNGRQLGLFPSLNRGIAAASSDLIARLDADDVCEPDRFTAQTTYLRQHQEIALVGSAYREIDVDGTERLLNELPSDETDLRWSMLFFCPFVHSAVMFRRDAIARTVGLYDETFSYAGDFELWLRIARRLRLTNLREPLVRVRVHPWSMTSADDQTHEATDLHVRELARLLPSDGESSVTPERYRHWFDVVFGHIPVSTADIERVERLHGAFCRDWQIPGDEGRRHWTLVRQRLGYRLAPDA